MRIGITCYPTYGGSGVVATELGKELAHRGHEVHFITYANPIRLETEISGVYYHEVKVASYPLFQHQPYTLALASRMSEVANKHELDLLHVHYAIPHSVSALLAKKILSASVSLPVVTTLHGTDITLVGIEQAYFPITRYAINSSDGITAISKYLAQNTKKVFNIRRPIKVIPNFVNYNLYKPENERESKRASQKTLIHISNFRSVKRATDCVRILCEVRRQFPARLLMVGDGPEQPCAQELAMELGVSHAVEFVGKQLHVNQLLSSADVFLLPSELEGFGLVALEAMACGVPVVATNTGGLPELITSGSDGFLESVGDILGQAERAIELLRDSDLYKRMSRAARKTAKKRFNTQLIIPMYEKYYEEVLSLNREM